jgi:hypothetical protein
MATILKLAIKNIYPNYQHYTDICRITSPFENRTVELRWLELEGTVKICSSYR